MINKLEGDFNDEDEAALVELAALAAPALANTQQLEATLAVNQLLVDRAAEAARLVGECPAIVALQSTLRRVAPTELAVLLLGENGTGKEVVSQAIHYLSPRRNQPFVAVNCAALTETLLESELFGHEKGAFTDAHESRIGKFELAAGGTLFLDEIGDMSRGGQSKLLRVLEEKIVVRVGGSKPIQVDVRVIAATNQNLAEMVRQKRFREDLFFRLNVVSLELPPLRDRGGDIMLLAEHFLSDFCRRAPQDAEVLRPPRGSGSNSILGRATCASCGT
ncbi:MAG: sigma-54 factor interaction domain-containing protein [Pirellulales bacterium]